ncbi:MAG: hypothetical protein IT375_08725 [Polyangiaceae bacterium]|nr:hypothetical protein [Polyangiaceae bacterium]MCK6537831.1 hypothetical protein [Polyangiaceae bacterium]
MKAACVILVSLGLGLGACSKIEEKMAEKAAEKATGGQVDIDSKTGKVKLKQKGPDGKESEVQLGEGSSVPADFPKAVPIYPGAKVMSAVTVSQGESHVVTLNTKDSTQQVLDFYKKNLASFKTDGELTGGDTTMLNVSNDQLTVGVTATKSSDDGTTLINLTTSAKKP